MCAWGQGLYEGSLSKMWLRYLQHADWVSVVSMGVRCGLHNVFTYCAERHGQFGIGLAVAWCGQCVRQ
jgi:hypothetical protein